MTKISGFKNVMAPIGLALLAIAFFVPTAHAASKCDTNYGFIYGLSCVNKTECETDATKQAELGTSLLSIAEIYDNVKAGTLDPANSFISGQCPGAVDIKCCLPKAGSTGGAGTSATSASSTPSVKSSAPESLDPTVVKLINPIGGTKDNPEGNVNLPKILGGILTKALGVMGSVALLMFVIGGALWLTSAGNSERVQKGTETMVWAAIGVLIIFSSYAILRLVLGGIGAEGIDGGGSSAGSGGTAETAGGAPADGCVPDTSIAKVICGSLATDKCKEQPFCTVEKVAKTIVETKSCVPDTEQNLGTICLKKDPGNCKSSGLCVWGNAKCDPDMGAASTFCAMTSGCGNTAGCVEQITKPGVATQTDACIPKNESELKKYCTAQGTTKCSGACKMKE